MGKKILSTTVNSMIEAAGLAGLTFALAIFARKGWDFAGRDSHENNPQNEEEA